MHKNHILQPYTSKVQCTLTKYIKILMYYNQIQSWTSYQSFEAVLTD